MVSRSSLKNVVLASMKGNSMNDFTVTITSDNDFKPMTREEYTSRLEDLYKLAVKLKNVQQALEILERINRIK
jgi:hypothetical protein